jgi:integrase
LSIEEVSALVEACAGRYRDLVIVLAYTGLRWGELAGLQTRDIVEVPSVGLRLQRAVLAGRGQRHLFVDSLKNHQARTVPLTGGPLEIVRAWSAGRGPEQWIFPSTSGTPLSEGNWKRMIRWSDAKRAIDRPSLRVHDLRHTAASIWLGAGADAKVVQRVLGHASAAMTLDLYGHLVDTNLWQAANRVADHTQTTAQAGAGKRAPDKR